MPCWLTVKSERFRTVALITVLVCSSLDAIVCGELQLYGVEIWRTCVLHYELVIYVEQMMGVYVDQNGLAYSTTHKPLCVICHVMLCEMTCTVCLYMHDIAVHGCRHVIQSDK